MSVLRRAYVEVLPDTTGFDGELTKQLRRKDVGTAAGKQVGGQLNRALKRLDLDPVDVKADPKKALAAIAATEERLKALGRDAATVEVKVRTEKALSELRRFKKQLGDIGGEAGPGPSFGKSLISGIGDAAAAVRPILLPALGGVAVAAAPFIGATIAGAVVGAAGVGGVAGGLILAARDPRVKAAATNLGQEVMRGLTTRAEVFIGPALQGVQKVRSAWHDFDADLTRIFDSSSGFVAPLIDGLLAGALKVGKGFANAVVSAQPVIVQLGRTFDDLGSAVGDIFTTMSKHAGEGALAIRDLTGAVVGLIQTVNNIVGPLATVYGWLSKANGAFKDFTNGMSILDALNPLGPLKELGSGLLDVTGITKQGPKAFGEWHDGAAAVAGGAAAAVVPLASFGDRMRGATSATKAFSDAMHAAFSDQLSLDQATLQLADGAKTLRDELNHGTRTLSLNSVEGRTNRAAVLQQLSAIEALRQARFDETGSTQIATGEYNKNITALRRSMLQAGFTRAEVDKLIGSYKRVPGKVNTTIGTPGLPQSDTGIKNYRAKLDALARRINTNVTVTGKRKAEDELKSLLIMQRALKGGISVSAASSAFNKQEAKAFDKGGFTGAGAKLKPAGVVHAGEYVFDKQATSNLGVPRLDKMHESAKRGYAAGGAVLDAPFPVNAAITRIPSRAEAMSAVVGSPGNWPSSPGAQRGDSGVWRWILAITRAAGFKNPLLSGYRAGDPKWHGSGRADDLGGFNQDALASFWAAKRPLELIHRTAKRDYAYTRGVNKGSFNNSLMEAHRNHVHVAMDDGGYRMLQPGMNLIPNGTGRPEPIAGPRAMAAMSGGGPVHVHIHDSVITSERQAVDLFARAYKIAKKERKIP